MHFQHNSVSFLSRAKCMWGDEGGGLSSRRFVFRMNYMSAVVSSADDLEIPRSVGQHARKAREHVTTCVRVLWGRVLYDYPRTKFYVVPLAKSSSRL